MTETTYGHTDKAGIEALLLGRTVVKVDDHTLRLDNGLTLTLPDTDGGCACSAGCYDLTELNGVDNVITKVDFEDDPAGDYEEPYREHGYYRIFVFADNQRINLATWQGSDGNGYYGTGYEIHVVAPAAAAAIEPVLERPHPAGEGVQKLYRFENGYGASVIRFLIRGFSMPVGSYGAENGLWELGVVKYTGPGLDNVDWELTSETPLGDEVHGHLDDQEVEELLQRIRDLPPVATEAKPSE